MRPASRASWRSSSHRACSATTRSSSLTRSCGGQGPGLVVAGGGVGRDHHRAQVAKVEVLGVGQGRVGAVAPLRRAEPGEQALGQLEELRAVDGRLAAGGPLLVLGRRWPGAPPGSRRAGPPRRWAAARPGSSASTALRCARPGRRRLGFGPLGQRRGSGPARAASLPPSGRSLRGRRSPSGRSLRGRRSPSGRSVRGRRSPSGRSVRGRGHRRRSLRAAVAVGPVGAGPAVAAVAPVAPVAADFDTSWVVTSWSSSRRPEPRISMRSGSVRLAGLGGAQREDRDALDVDLGLGPEDVADLGAVGHERGLDDAAGLLGPSGAPRPGTIAAITRQLDLDPAGHGGRG